MSDELFDSSSFLFLVAIVIIAGLAYNHRVVLAELAAYRNQQAELADTLRELKTALASRPERWQGRAYPHNQSERTSDERANPDSPDRPPAEGTRSQPSQTSGTSHKRTCGVCKKTCKSAEGLAAHNRAKHGTGGAASHATPQTPQLASGPNYAGLTSSHPIYFAPVTHFHTPSHSPATQRSRRGRGCGGGNDDKKKDGITSRAPRRGPRGFRGSPPAADDDDEMLFVAESPAPSRRRVSFKFSSNARRAARSRVRAVHDATEDDASGSDEDANEGSANGSQGSMQRQLAEIQARGGLAAAFGLEPTEPRISRRRDSLGHSVVSGHYSAGHGGRVARVSLSGEAAQMMRRASREVIQANPAAVSQFLAARGAPVAAQVEQAGPQPPPPVARSRSRPRHAGPPCECSSQETRAALISAPPQATL